MYKDIHYQPAKLLCDLIKKSGYDGLIYPGGLGTDINIVFLDPQKADTKDISNAYLTNIHYEDHEILEGLGPMR